MRILTSKPRTSGCVHKSKNFWNFPRMSPNNLNIGLPNALRKLGFDPHYPFGVLYKEPLGNIEEEELKSKETIVHCCLSFSCT